MGVCVQRFRALPGGAELLEERYPPFQPDVDQLEQLPQGSLGHAYAGMIRKLNYDRDFFRPRDTSTDALWLTERIATQIGFPAYVLLNLLASFKAVRLKPKELEAISYGIAHGNRIGLQATPLVTQKWEEGWDKPLDQWRQELGVIVADHPEISANYS